jgi:hypothetical protein
MYSDFEVVFVELNRIPKYSILNIERTRKLFPNIKITLLTNMKNHLSVIHLLKKGICSIEEVDLNSLRVEIMQKSERVVNKSDFFWIATLERIFLLLDYHEKVPNKKLLHVESDVILFPKFPWSSFKELNRVAWGRYSATHDVAALVFSPNSKESQRLKSSLIAEITKNPNLTDMTVLSVISRKAKNNVCILPSAPLELKEVMEIKENCSDRDFEEISQELIRFQGVFDLGVVGMWLDGIDANHNFGKSSNMPLNVYDRGESLIDLRNIKFSVSDGGQLAIVTSRGPIDVFSLHIHSKRTSWFKEGWENELKTVVESVNEGERTTRFLVKVFLYVLLNNFKQRTLLRLVLRKILPNNLWKALSSFRSKFH